jgi:hypothetical protein
MPHGEHKAAAGTSKRVSITTFQSWNGFEAPGTKAETAKGTGRDGGKRRENILSARPPSACSPAYFPDCGLPGMQ